MRTACSLLILTVVIVGSGAKAQALSADKPTTLPVATAATAPALTPEQLPVTTSPAKVTLDELIPLLQANETAIRTFQGRARQTEYVVTPIGRNGRMNHPLQEPRIGAITDLEFRHDRTRGSDYWVKMRAGPENKSATPIVVERRNGNLVEALLSDRSEKPVKGIVPEQPNARYLGHQPENFLSRTSIHLLTSESPTGALDVPLSGLLKNRESVWVDDQPADINGQPCVKIVAISPVGERTRRVSFIYLGREVGFCIVKAQTILVNAGLPLDAPRQMNTTQFRALLAQLEAAAPELLTVHQEYRRTAIGVWIPRVSTAYIMRSAGAHELGEGVSSEVVTTPALRDPMTKHLKKAAMLGYCRFELDMESLVLNRPIPKDVFEKSIIPEKL